MKCLGFHSIWRRNLRNLRCLRLGLFHAPLAFPIIRGLQVNPLGSNPITAPSMTSLVKYSLLLLLTEKMERAPPYIILVKSLESVAFRRLLQDNKNITTLTQWKKIKYQKRSKNCICHTHKLQSFAFSWFGIFLSRF